MAFFKSMTDKEKRRKMVETQLIPRGIKDKNVINAMLKIPRHLFVGEDMYDRAYDDVALPIGGGQTISQPYMVAVMTELLKLSGVEKVLEIGTGSGYQAAILGELAKEVYTIERVAELAENAKNRIKSLGYNNIHIKAANGTLGWEEKSPFDGVIITAAAPDIPSILIEQLSYKGVIVAPVGDRHSQQLLRLRKDGEKITEDYSVPCIFVPLIGEHGWNE